MAVVLTQKIDGPLFWVLWRSRYTQKAVLVGTDDPAARCSRPWQRCRPQQQPQPLAAKRSLACDGMPSSPTRGEMQFVRCNPAYGRKELSNFDRQPHLEPNASATND